MEISTGIGGLRVLDGVPVAMRDGVLLATDIWLPATEGPVPFLLQRTPYGRTDAFGAQYIASLSFRAAMRLGFGIAVQDTRGRHGSGGQFEPFEHEEHDGLDTIDWLRRQSYCDGTIGMFGTSYVGATQVLAAAGKPEGLKAIVPQLTTGRHGATWTYKGGALELGFLLLWIVQELGPHDLSKRNNPDLDSVIAEMRRDLAATYERLPLLDAPLESIAPYTRGWFDDRRAKLAEANREGLDRIASANVSTLVVAGWNDIFVEGSIELFQTVRSRCATARETPHRLIVGPWSHGNQTDWQGDSWHGFGASNADVPAAQLAFFENQLLGSPMTAPMVRYFRSGSNTWHTADDWPIPGAARRPLYLDANESRLVSDPNDSSSRQFTSDPSAPVPTAGGATFLPGVLLGKNSGPKDQSRIEARDDVVTFTSAQFERDTEVTGFVEAVLWVSSSAPTCDWTVRICDVDEEGRSIGRVDGIIRWTNPTIGQPSEVSVGVGHMSHSFRSGSRLRVQIASSNFPRFDRNPQSLSSPTLARREDFAVARQTLFTGTAFPSRIIVPVIETPSIGSLYLSGAA